MSAGGLNVTRLAERAGLPYRTLQDYLSGKHRVPASAIPGLARTLDVSADWLLTGEPVALHPPTLRRALRRVHAIIEATRAGGRGSATALELASAFYLAYLEYYTERFGRPADEEDLQRRLGEFHLRMQGEITD